MGHTHVLASTVSPTFVCFFVFRFWMILGKNLHAGSIAAVTSKVFMSVGISARPLMVTATTWMTSRATRGPGSDDVPALRNKRSSDFWKCTNSCRFCNSTKTFASQFIGLGINLDSLEQSDGYGLCVSTKN